MKKHFIQFISLLLIASLVADSTPATMTTQAGLEPNGWNRSIHLQRNRPALFLAQALTEPMQWTHAILGSSFDIRTLGATIAQQTNGSSTDVEFILSRFGMRWQKAVSLIGSALFDVSRRSIIDQIITEALAYAHEKCSSLIPLNTSPERGAAYMELLDGQFAVISVLADYLHYVESPVLFETFPTAFQQLVLRHSWGRSGQRLHTGVLNYFWTIYSFHRSQPKTNPHLDYVALKGRSETGPVQNSANVSDNDLVRRVLQPRKTRKGMYLFLSEYHRKTGQATIELPPDAFPSSENTRLHLQFSRQSASFDPRRIYFHVWLVDPTLLAQLANIEYQIPGLAYPRSGVDKDRLLLGTVTYEKAQKGETFDIQETQAWLRLSPQMDQTVRSALGSIETLLEQSFRIYAGQERAKRIRAPTGSEQFDLHPSHSLHRNTIERLDAIYEQAGYHLRQLSTKTYDWEYDLPAVENNLVRPLPLTGDDDKGSITWHMGPNSLGYRLKRALTQPLPGQGETWERGAARFGMGWAVGEVLLFVGSILYFVSLINSGHFGAFSELVYSFPISPSFSMPLLAASALLAWKGLEKLFTEIARLRGRSEAEPMQFWKELAHLLPYTFLAIPHLSPLAYILLALVAATAHLAQDFSVLGPRMMLSTRWHTFALRLKKSVLPDAVHYLVTPGILLSVFIHTPMRLWQSDLADFLNIRYPREFLWTTLQDLSAAILVGGGLLLARSVVWGLFRAEGNGTPARNVILGFAVFVGAAGVYAVSGMSGDLTFALSLALQVYALAALFLFAVHILQSRDQHPPIIGSPEPLTPPPPDVLAPPVPARVLDDGQPTSGSKPKISVKTSTKPKAADRRRTRPASESSQPQPSVATRPVRNVPKPPPVTLDTKAPPPTGTAQTTALAVRKPIPADQLTENQEVLLDNGRAWVICRIIQLEEMGMGNVKVLRVTYQINGAKTALVIGRNKSSPFYPMQSEPRPKPTGVAYAMTASGQLLLEKEEALREARERVEVGQSSDLIESLEVEIRTLITEYIPIEETNLYFRDVIAGIIAALAKEGVKPLWVFNRTFDDLIKQSAELYMDHHKDRLRVAGEWLERPKEGIEDYEKKLQEFEAHLKHIKTLHQSMAAEMKKKLGHYLETHPELSYDSLKELSGLLWSAAYQVHQEHNANHIDDPQVPVGFADLSNTGDEKRLHRDNQSRAIDELRDLSTGEDLRILFETGVLGEKYPWKTIYAVNPAFMRRMVLELVDQVFGAENRPDPTVATVEDYVKIGQLSKAHYHTVRLPSLGDTLTGLYRYFGREGGWSSRPLRIREKLFGAKRQLQQTSKKAYPLVLTLEQQSQWKELTARYEHDELLAHLNPEQRSDVLKFYVLSEAHRRGVGGLAWWNRDTAMRVVQWTALAAPGYLRPSQLMRRFPPALENHPLLTLTRGVYNAIESNMTLTDTFASWSECLETAGVQSEIIAEIRSRRRRPHVLGKLKEKAEPTVSDQTTGQSPAQAQAPAPLPIESKSERAVSLPPNQAKPTEAINPLEALDRLLSDLQADMAQAMNRAGLTERQLETNVPLSMESARILQAAMSDAIPPIYKLLKSKTFKASSETRLQMVSLWNMLTLVNNADPVQTRMALRQFLRETAELRNSIRGGSKALRSETLGTKRSREFSTRSQAWYVVELAVAGVLGLGLGYYLLTTPIHGVNADAATLAIFVRVSLLIVNARFLWGIRKRLSAGLDDLRLLASRVVARTPLDGAPTEFLEKSTDRRLSTASAVLGVAGATPSAARMLREELWHRRGKAVELFVKLRAYEEVKEWSKRLHGPSSEAWKEVVGRWAQETLDERPDLRRPLGERSSWSQIVWQHKVLIGLIAQAIAGALIITQISALTLGILYDAPAKYAVAGISVAGLNLWAWTYVMARLEQASAYMRDTFWFWYWSSLSHQLDYEWEVANAESSARSGEFFYDIQDPSRRRGADILTAFVRALGSDRPYSVAVNWNWNLGELVRWVKDNHRQVPWITLPAPARYRLLERLRTLPDAQPMIDTLRLVFEDFSTDIEDDSHHSDPSGSSGLHIREAA